MLSVDTLDNHKVFYCTDPKLFVEPPVVRKTVNIIFNEVMLRLAGFYDNHSKNLKDDFYILRVTQCLYSVRCQDLRNELFDLVVAEFEDYLDFLF
jgi:hypothetical protein